MNKHLKALSRQFREEGLFLEGVMVGIYGNWLLEISKYIAGELGFILIFFISLLVLLLFFIVPKTWPANQLIQGIIGMAHYAILFFDLEWSGYNITKDAFLTNGMFFLIIIIYIEICRNPHPTEISVGYVRR